jgi:uracil-DNA glycosylase family 4
MNLSALEKAMLSEMGIYWPHLDPDLKASSADMAPAPSKKTSPKPTSIARPAATLKNVTLPLSHTKPQALVQNWEVLKTAIHDCQACPLGQVREQALDGMGNSQADCFILGETPSEWDDEQGQLATGDAGTLLKMMLRSIGLTLEEATPDKQVFFSTAVKCKPPRQRNPHNSELEACRGFLQHQIEWVKPKVILAVGRLAAQQLLGTEEALGALRGRTHLYQSIPTIVTYSPAYLLRHPSDKAGTWQDLCRVKQLLA